MGGLGSGSWYRWSKKTYIEDCRNLDINRMVKVEGIPHSGWRSGSWIWTNSRTGEQVSSIGYEADTRDPSSAFLRVHYTVTSTGEKFDYKIRLERTRTNFNGWRWWFICPYKHKRVTKLYLPSGGGKYASRHAYRLSYASQSETAADRALRKGWRYKNRIGGQEWPQRPKGMHERTYRQLYEKACHMEQIVDYYFLQKFGRHDPQLF